MNDTAGTQVAAKRTKRPLPEALTKLIPRVTAYRPALADLCGSVSAGLMLSQALYWSERTGDADGWFYKTAGDWTHELAMGYEQQEGARKKLRKFTFWSEKRKDVCGTMHYRVDYEELTRELNRFRQKPETRQGRTPKPDSANARRAISEKHHGGSGETPGTYKEAEITQEITQRTEGPISSIPIKSGNQNQERTRSTKTKSQCATDPNIEQFLNSLPNRDPLKPLCKYIWQTLSEAERVTFDTFLKPCRFAGADSSVLVLAMPHEGFRFSCKRLQEEIMSAIKGLGMPFYDVSFIVRSSEHGT